MSNALKSVLWICSGSMYCENCQFSHRRHHSFYMYMFVTLLIQCTTDKKICMVWSSLLVCVMVLHKALTDHWVNSMTRHAIVSQWSKYLMPLFTWSSFIFFHADFFTLKALRSSEELESQDFLHGQVALSSPIMTAAKNRSQTFQNITWPCFPLFPIFGLPGPERFPLSCPIKYPRLKLHTYHSCLHLACMFPCRWGKLVIEWFPAKSVTQLAYPLCLSMQCSSRLYIWVREYLEWLLAKKIICLMYAPHFHCLDLPILISSSKLWVWEGNWRVVQCRLKCLFLDPAQPVNQQVEECTEKSRK